MTFEKSKKKFLNYDPNALFHTFDKLKMYGKAQGAVKPSILSWGCWNGNPRITINTNIEEDKVNKSGMLIAAFNPETFYILLDYLEIVANGANDTSYKFECKTTTELSEGGRSEPFVSSSVMVGKDAEGKVWMSVIAENRPKIKFVFMVSSFHTIHEKGKGPISEDIASKLQALACIRLLRQGYYKLVLDYKSNQGKRVVKDGETFTNENTTITSSNLNFDDITM